MVDVRRIVERLLQHVNDESQREFARLVELNPENLARREEIEKDCEQAYRISVTIVGRDGESLFGHGIEPFDSPNLPEPVLAIYISNVAAYQAIVGRAPTNTFTLHLDFSIPPLIDNENPVSSPTQNFSNFTVEGDRNEWVASIHQAVMDVIEKKWNGRKFLHAASVYDIGLFFLGFPASIYLCWRFSGHVETWLGAINPFLSGAAYIYIFFLILNLYRVLFGYTKWAFPTVELASNESRSKRHRTFWFVLLAGIAASTISDLI